MNIDEAARRLLDMSRRGENRQALSFALLLPALLASTLVSGCDSQCSADDTTTRYGLVARFAQPIALDPQKVLQLDVYRTPLGPGEWHEPIGHCVSTPGQIVNCNRGADVVVEAGKVTGFAFNSDALKPEWIVVVAETRPTVSSGPVTSLGQGDVKLAYQPSVHEVRCSDGKTKDIERAEATVDLRL